MARRNWIVSAVTDDHEPMIFGPYNETRAEELATKLNERASKSGDFSYFNASAYPIPNAGITEMAAEFGL